MCVAGVIKASDPKTVQVKVRAKYLINFFISGSIHVHIPVAISNKKKCA